MRIQQVCLAESQAFTGLNDDGWAAAHYQGEGADMSWNSPDGIYNNVHGWSNMTEALKNYMQSATKDAGKLSQSNFSILIHGNMAHVGFDQFVTGADGKTGKSKQHRTMLYDGRDTGWKIVVMNAFLDYSSTK